MRALAENERAELEQYRSMLASARQGEIREKETNVRAGEQSLRLVQPGKHRSGKTNLFETSTLEDSTLQLGALLELEMRIE